ncbi:MAG TPA: DUF1501 domain-containing protein [Gaiellaceae bacterium]|nr:DUF1501 domain-containing protein [Gaiellaceae bacterium]
MTTANRHHHCNEFSRSSLLRRGAAAAGRGLPAIEPGMPAPAGTGLSRGTFLSRTLGAALTVYGSAAFGPRAFEEAIARAATGPSAHTTLVSVFAPGGWDSLSLLYPNGDPAYRRLRPQIAFKPGDGPVFESDSRLHWHPELEPFAKLHAQGKLTVFPAIGYTHPDQSHFTSRHYWEVGALDPQLSTGWLGRVLDVIGDESNAMQGLSLDSTLLPSIATARVPVATLQNPSAYGFDSQNVWDVPGTLLQDAIGSLGGLSVATDPFLTQASEIAGQSDQLRRQLGRFIDANGQAHYETKVKYPDNGQFSTSLAGLAAMLHTGFPIRAAALQAPGEYDTHSEESGPLSQGLQQTAQALAAFQHDLEQRNLGQRVITLIWSEFGRRAEQNDTNGTDHGAAGVAFLLGERVKHRMVGEFPGLGRGLDANGNLRETVDYRAVYKSLAEEWFGVDGDLILPDGKTMPSLSLLA